MAHRGKRYRQALGTIDREHAYSPLEAVRMLKDLQTSAFDESVEAHFRLGLNVRHADQQLRGTLMLPHGTGRGANVHLTIGKKSFGERELIENYAAVVEEIVRAKPAAAKGRYIRGITLASTMSPGIHVDSTRTRGIVDELGDAESADADS